MGIRVLLLLFFIVPRLAYGSPDPYSIQMSMPGIALGHHLEILEDPQGNLSVKDLVHLSFRPSLEELPNFGPSTSAFWSRFTLSNPYAQPVDVYIENRMVAPDHQSFFVRGTDGKLQEFVIDETRPFNTWNLQHRHPALRLTLAPGETQIHVRTQNLTGNLHALLIWDLNAFQVHHSWDLFLISFLFGILLAMGLYNLFLLLSLRRLDIIFYVGFNLSFILWQLTYTGVLTQFIPDTVMPSSWSTKWMLGFGQLASLFALGFCSQFLKVWGGKRWLDDVCLGVIALGVFNLLTLAFNVTYLSSLVVPIHVMLTAALISLLSLRSCWQRYRPAYFFLGAWLSLIVGATFTVGSSLRLFTYRVESEWAIFIGAAIESILLSAALGYKWSYAIKVDAEAKNQAAILKKSLDDARIIQKAILPKMENLPGLKITSSYRSAEQIGGDLYGHHYDSVHQRLYFYIGDVTGHGLPSALLSVAVAGALRFSLSKAYRESDLIPQVLDSIAHDLTQMISEMSGQTMHMTMTICVINLMTLECHYLNAGHNAFYQISQGIAQGILRGGSPLGRTEAPVYGHQKLQLSPGDMLFFYTDGLLENQGPKGQMISPRVLKSLLQGSRSGAEIRERILARSLELWGDRAPSDDCTFVAIELV